jgi:hypothetical protein
MNLLTNLVAYYKLDNGALLVDSVGSRTLTNTGSVAETASGKINGGADFGSPNSTKDLRYTTDDYGIGYNGAMSYQVWFKLNHEITSGESEIAIIFKGATDTVNYAVMQVIYQYNGGTPRLRFMHEGGTSSTQYYNVTLGTGWHQLVFTFDGSSTQVGYLDGSQVTTDNVWTSGLANTANFFVIGQYGIYNLDWFSGFMDELGLWSRVLTGTEVSSLWNGSNGLPFSSFGSGGTTVVTVPTLLSLNVG